jgi:DNA-binding SARP family transcriptional activator/tetratricopeptide (TPR) repeat protein
MSDLPPPIAQEGPGEAVRICTLGRFTVQVRGQPLRQGNRGWRKPLGLLKLLIALGGTHVPELQLSDTLWPHSDGDQAYATFKTNLHRLRKLIGHDAVQLEDRRLTLLPHHCWVDALAFPSALHRVTQAIEAGDDEGAWVRMQRALGLYAGPFLEGESEPPHILTMRERLHATYLRHVELFAEHLGRRGQPERATDLCRRAVDLDELAETIYQRWMACCLQAGLKAEGMAVYERCRQALHARLERDPAPDTERLYRALREAALAPSPPGEAVPTARPPEPIADAVAAERSAGERRQATVAVLALSGQAALGEALEPEQMHDAQAALELNVERVVERYGGILNQASGAMLVAVFGVPAAHEDDALRAVRAAQEAHAWVRGAGAPLSSPEGPALRLRTGISTGLLVVDRTTHRHAQYAISGEPLVAAERLAGRAGADEILVSGETRLLVAPFFETQADGPASRKAGAWPDAAYRIVAPTGVTTPFDASKRRGLTPFVGRERELETLGEGLASAVAGTGQFLTVVGEAGVGKSRLVHQFRQGLDRERIVVVEGRCQATGSGTPYLPFLDAMRRGLRLRSESSGAALHDKAVRNIRGVDPALEPYLPFYLHLLSIPSERHALPEGLQGEELRRCLMESVAALMTLDARRQPLVCIFEDWHWADEASHAALMHVLGLVAHCPALVVVTYRPVLTREWGGPEQVTPIALKPLTVQYTERVARSVLRTRELPEGLGPLIHERTGGNPFFVEEVCRALLEERTVVVQGGRAVLNRALDALQLPAAVHAVIRARVDRLRPAALEVLRLAAVIGREFTGRILERVLPAAAQLTPVLEELKAQDLIQQVRVLPEPDYVFKHVLTQIVVYETLLLKQRRELHGAVGRAIEALNPGRSEECCEALAHHYRHSDDPARALHFLEMAGDKAARSFALQSAANCYHDVVELLEAQEQDEAARRRGVDIRLKWAAVSYYMKPHDQIERLQAALQVATALQDEGLQARLMYWLGRIEYVLGNVGRSQDWFQGAVGKAEQLDESELLAMLYSSTGRACLLASEFRKGRGYLEKGMSLLERAANQEELSYAASFLGLILAHLGDFERSFAMQRKSLQIADATRNRTYRSSNLMRLGMSQVIFGDWKAAIAAYDESIRIADEIRNTLVTGMAMGGKGVAVFMCGQRDEGIALMLQGIERLEGSGSHLAFSFFLANLAEMYALQGSVERAVASASKAVAFRASGETFGDYIAFRALAIAASREHAPDWEQVESHFCTSLDLAHACGARSYVAVTLFRQAELMRSRGDQIPARKALADASALFREMQMTWWLSQADALREQLLAG